MNEALAAVLTARADWASEFAPPTLQKIVSYFAGWLSSIAWLAGTASAMFLSGSAMMGLLVVTQPGYAPEAWHGYLFTVMVASFALFVNTVLARHLPRLEGIVFVLFVIAFMATLVVLWVLAPRLSASEYHFRSVQRTPLMP